MPAADLALFRRWPTLRDRVPRQPFVEAPTPVVISPNDPRLLDVRCAVEKQYPAAIWVVWEDRIDLDPVTLEAVAATDGAAGGGR